MITEALYNNIYNKVFCTSQILNVSFWWKKSSYFNKYDSILFITIYICVCFLFHSTLFIYLIWTRLLFLLLQTQWLSGASRGRPTVIHQLLSRKFVSCTLFLFMSKYSDTFWLYSSFTVPQVSCNKFIINLLQVLILPIMIPPQEASISTFILCFIIILRCFAWIF